MSLCSCLVLVRNINYPYHSYADDTELYIELSSDDPSPVNKLVYYINDIVALECANESKLIAIRFVNVTLLS